MRQALLSGLASGSGIAVEIGPLDRPVLAGPVLSGGGWRRLYVDHASTEELRAKYAADPGVRVDRLVAIDHVWNQHGLDGLVQAYGPADVIVASHVAEHVPDLIGWLAALGRALAPGGEIRLVIPDKRFCFDHHRAESTLADLLAARAAGSRTPPLARIADYILHVVEVDAAAVWAGDVPPPPTVDAQRYAWAASVCEEVQRSGRYHDVHCWVFTPGHACRLLADLVAFGVLSFECTLFQDTEPDGLEFLLGLRPAQDPVAAASSWRDAAARAVAAPAVRVEPAAGRPKPAGAWLRRLRALRSSC